MKLCMGCMEQIDDGIRTCPYCGYDESTQKQESYYLPPGTILQGKYIIGKVLSYRNFMVKYIGLDAEANRKVTISEYLPSDFSTRSDGDLEVAIYSGDAYEQFNQGLMTFLNEGNTIQTMGSLPGISEVYDCVAENDTGYLITEYLDGETLEDALKAGRKFSVEETLTLMNEILMGLKTLHQQGIVHCDISPETIVLKRDGGGKLTDFGAVRYATTVNSKSLAIILKQGYAPEEQYRSQGSRGPWTDVYALAAVMYRMLTGKVPMESIERALEDTLEAPSKLGASIPSSVENAMMNALNVYQEERTASAGLFYQELNAPNTKRRKIKKRKRETGKMPIWVKGLAGVVACAVIVGIVLIVKNRSNDDGGDIEENALNYVLNQTTLGKFQEDWENTKTDFDKYVDVEYRYVSDESKEEVIMELNSEDVDIAPGTLYGDIKKNLDSYKEKKKPVKLVVASNIYYTFLADWALDLKGSGETKKNVNYYDKVYPGPDAIPSKAKDAKSKDYGLVRDIKVDGETVYTYDDAYGEDKKKIQKALEKSGKLQKISNQSKLTVTIYKGVYYNISNKEYQKYYNTSKNAAGHMKVTMVSKKATQTVLKGNAYKKLCEPCYCFNSSGFRPGRILGVRDGSALEKGKDYVGNREKGEVLRISKKSFAKSASLSTTVKKLKDEGFDLIEIYSEGGSKLSGNESGYKVTSIEAASDSAGTESFEANNVKYFTRNAKVKVIAEPPATPKPRVEKDTSGDSGSGSGYSGGSSYSGSGSSGSGSSGSGSSGSGSSGSGSGSSGSGSSGSGSSGSGSGSSGSGSSGSGSSGGSKSGGGGEGNANDL